MLQIGFKWPTFATARDIGLGKDVGHQSVSLASVTSWKRQKRRGRVGNNPNRPAARAIDGNLRVAADCHFGAIYFSRDLTNQGCLLNISNDQGLVDNTRTLPAGREYTARGRGGPRACRTRNRNGRARPKPPTEKVVPLRASAQPRSRRWSAARRTKTTPVARGPRFSGAARGFETSTAPQPPKCRLPHEPLAK